MGEIKLFTRSKKSALKSKLPTEEQEQIKLVVWLTGKGIKHFAIPNGGKRSLSEGVRFKRCGVKKGVPDLCIPIPSGSYHGLYIELKREEGGRLSEEQMHWLAFLNDQGYYAQVARGFEEAKIIVLEYFDMTPQAA